jgi:hypothetical protein
MRKLQVFLSSAMNGELETERSVIKTLFKTDTAISKFLVICY